ncbi:MAG: FtsQ-type POTRA domain-containing protein [Burkholderiales bacterium]|nr:FtsQ-type POTRA domain-containing protein [Burkholderiales bacterium]
MNGTRFMEFAARLLFGLTLLALAGTAVAWVAQRPAFDFARVELRGGAGELQHVTVAAVRAAVASKLRGGFFTMRLDEARRVFESVPWVADASVRRVWPDRLIVTLTEHRALGVWGDGRLLSDTGVLFVANVAEAEIYGPLPQFEGPAKFAPEAARLFYALAAQLAPLSLQLEELRVSERASWALRARQGEAEVEIELGRDEPVGTLTQRMTLAMNSFPVAAAKFGAPPARIDVRYPNGFAAAAPAESKNTR